MCDADIFWVPFDALSIHLNNSQITLRHDRLLSPPSAGTRITFKGRFVSLDLAKTLCDRICPDGYITKQFSVVNAFKGIDDNISFDVCKALDDDDRVEIGCAEGTVMQLVNNIRVSRDKSVHYVGCFGPNYAVPNKSDVVNDVGLDANERISVRGGQRVMIPGGVQEAFNRYARERFATITAAVDNAPKIKRTQQRKPLIDNAKKKRPNTADAPRPAPSREEEIQQLRTSLGDNILKRRSVDSTIESVLRRLKELECDVIEGKKEKLHFIMPNGRGGSIDIDPDCSVILLSQLTDSLLEEEVTEPASVTISSDNNTSINAETTVVSQDDQATTTMPDETVTDENQPPLETSTTKPPPAGKSPKPKQYQYVWNHRYSCWIPKSKVLSNNAHNTAKKNNVSIARNARKLKKKRTAFSKRSKDIIAASSLAAAGASDWGVQSVIFGTMKAMAHEMGLKISDKQLTAACPDVGS
eukprot:scaffold85518_cov22-Cyclotella_meneghiniana.AAC.2